MNLDVLKTMARKEGFDLIRRPGQDLNKIYPPEKLPAWNGWYKLSQLSPKDFRKHRSSLDFKRLCGIYLIAESKEMPKRCDETEAEVDYIGQTTNLKTRLYTFYRVAGGFKGNHWGGHMFWEQTKPEHLQRREHLYFAFRVFPWEDRSLLTHLEKETITTWTQAQGSPNKGPWLNRGRTAGDKSSENQK